MSTLVRTSDVRRRRRGAERALAAALSVGAALAALIVTPGGSGATAVAGGCDRFASPHGHRHANGSLQRPFAGAERLVESLHRGQTGCLLGGTYRFRQLVIDTRGITLRPFRSRPTRLLGEIKVVPSGAGSTIEHMLLNGARGKNRLGPRIYADGVTLRGNRITNRHRGICILVTRYFGHPAPQRVVIERNRIFDCGRLPANNHEHGIYLAQARGTIVRDNWIYDNADRGIQLYPAAQGTTISGNVIAANGQGVVFSGSGSQASNDNVASGNVIVNSRRGWNVYSGGDGPAGRGNVVRNNCVFSSPGNGRHRSNGGIETPSRSFAAHDNVVARPRFMGSRRDDFRLRARSRCRGAYSGTLSR